MAITPEALREVTFRWAPLRGYHPDDVDEFLERMAAGIEILTQRVRDATEHAVRVEQANPAPELPDDDDSMRDLILASQAVADEALDKARDEARRVLARAEEYARILLEEAIAATDRTRKEACAATEADLRKLRTARDRLHVQALAVEHDTIAAPLPGALPAWPACLHAVEQAFPVPTH
ncbi:MAG: DivIVA protein [Actinomycetota bacterium]|jgi:DivIVA domain-containing protein|nr:DivIVA protein [Actinomycetota bacterium]